MNDRQPELKLGSYRVMNVTSPVKQSDLTGGARARVQMMMERDDGDDELANFDRDSFIRELSQFLHIPANEITVVSIEKGSVRVVVELPSTAAQELYLVAGDTLQGLVSLGDEAEKRDRTGQRIRDYELREQIGAGGFGAVYRAYQPNVLRDVAIKIILPSYASQPEFIKRFEHEARLVARLEHMNIVPLYDFWRDDNGAYLVMRWLRGGSLRRKLIQGPLETQAVARILNQIGSALAFAHQQGVIHRDIKPDNILLDEAGNAYLSDFGIAKDFETDLAVTGQGVMHGTPHYMSPEPFRGELITSLSDVYSLGVVLYELLTGERPYGTISVAEVVYKKLHEPLPVLQLQHSGISDAINDVIQKATAKDSARRYPDAMSFAAAFERAVRPDRKAAHVVHAPVLTPVLTIPILGKLKATVYDRADLILEKPRQLIGRDEQVANIRRFLDDNERVLLQGLGGIGKTSLAATVAAGWIDAGKGSVLWLEAANENAGALFEALAAAMAEPGAVVNKSGDDRLQTVRRLLSEHKGLFVIDNIWNERALYELMKAVPPNLPVLMTSRHAIPIDGEIIDVGDLTPDKALELLNYHARRDFRSDHDARNLCALLGHHPFTLEIAGKRLKINRSLSPGQLIVNIESAPHELDMPDTFADMGRKGVKDLLDASVSELDQHSRLVLVHMGGLFSPIASLELLLLVTDLSQERLDKTLDDLQQRGLIEVVSQMGDIPAYYRLHDLTYSYVRALHKAQFTKRDAVVRAITVFADDHAHQFNALEFEQPNLLGGAKFALTEDTPQALIDIMTVLAVRGYMDARGHTLALLERLDEAIAAARQMQPQTAETLHYLLGKRGNAYRDRGDLDNALKSYQEALSVAPNPTREAFLLGAIGTTASFQGDEKGATEYLDRAYHTAKANNDDLALSFVLEHMGHHAKTTKDTQGALRLFEEALQVAERLGDPGRRFFALLNLGAQHTELGQFDKALVNHERAYQIAVEHDNHLWTANALQCIGEDYDGLGNREKAQSSLLAALEQFRSFGATVRVTEMIQFMTQKAYATEY